MTLAELKATLNSAVPPEGLSPLVEAMWWQATGNWERAHLVAQEVAGRDGAWVHAYLHRAEGDLGNAAYWYRQTGRTPVGGDMEREWEAIVAALLATSHAA